MTITLSIGLFILLIVTNAILWIVLFLIFYLICGVHDLIVSDKVAEGKYDDCPYFVEKDPPENPDKKDKK